MLRLTPCEAPPRWIVRSLSVPKPKPRRTLKGGFHPTTLESNKRSKEDLTSICVMLRFL
jgi:hypothetical protein